MSENERKPGRLAGIRAVLAGGWRRWKGWILVFGAGAIFAYLFMHLFSFTVHVTGTNEFCGTCHEMGPFIEQWQLSSHYDNDKGVVADCVDCHLPPEGMTYLTAKAWLGLVDVYGHFFKDLEQIDWRAKLEHKNRFLWDQSCRQCHQNLTPPGLPRGGFLAHREYLRGRTDKSCADCHENLVHYPVRTLHAAREVDD